MDENSIGFSSCIQSSKCFDGERSTANCWIIIYSQLAVSLALLMFLPIFYTWRIAKRNKDEASNTPDNNIVKLEPLQEDVDPTESWDENLDENPVSAEDRKCSLSKTFRSEQNFIKSNFDSRIQFPSSYKPEYSPCIHMTFIDFSKRLFKLIGSSYEARVVFLNTLGLSLFSSCISSVIALYLKYEFFMKGDLCPDDEKFDAAGQIHILLGHAESVTAICSSFKFLPIFLLVAYTTFVVDRWRTFLRVCHQIQGVIHDIGILTGSIVAVPVPVETKGHLYRIYRYLNMLHILCFASFIPSLVDTEDDITDFGSRIGLLTDEEAKLIFSLDNKARDGLTGLLMYEIRMLIDESSGSNAPCVMVLTEKVLRLRSLMAKTHDMFTLLYPNEYVVIMNLLVTIYSVVLIFGYPIVLFNELSDKSSVAFCLQPMVFVGVFFTLLALHVTKILFQKLKNPFTENGDGIEVVQLIASTELSIFHSMRILFHRDKIGRIFCSLKRGKQRRMSDTILSSVRKGGFGDL